MPSIWPSKVGPSMNDGMRPFFFGFERAMKIVSRILVFVKNS